MRALLYIMQFTSQETWAPVYMTGKRTLSSDRAEADLMTRDEFDALSAEIRESHPRISIMCLPGNFSMGTTPLGPRRPRRVPPPVRERMEDPDHLVARGFTPRDARDHYSWVLRHRILAARRADPRLTLQCIGDQLGVSANRVRQLVEKAKREERHPSGNCGMSRVARYLRSGADPRELRGRSVPAMIVQETDA